MPDKVHEFCYGVHGPTLHVMRRAIPGDPHPPFDRCRPMPEPNKVSLQVVGLVPFDKVVTVWPQWPDGHRYEFAEALPTGPTGAYKLILREELTVTPIPPERHENTRQTQTQPWATPW
jgi:hypothetical protein